MATPQLQSIIEQLHTRRGQNWQQHRAFLTQLLPLVAQGMPVSVAQIATTLKVPSEEVSTLLGSLRKYGCEFDAGGNLVGAILTQKPTPHRFRVARQDLYAWCALDTLFLPALMQQSAEVGSHCPVTRQEITLLVNPEHVESCCPPEAVVSVVTTECYTSGPQGDFCSRIFFFASKAMARQWDRDLSGIEFLPVAEAFTVAQSVYR